MELIKHLFNRKYELENTEQEALWMKQPYFRQKKLLTALHSTQIPLPSAIQALTDIQLRERLADRHCQIIQQYKNEMMNILTDSIEVRLSQSQKLFDDELAYIWQHERTLPLDQQLNQTAIDLMYRHLLLISEKVQYIYYYKNIIPKI